MATPACRARGAVPVVDSECVLGLGTGFRVSCKEAGKDGVRLGGKGVDGQGPALLLRKAEGMIADELAAGRAGNLGGVVEGKFVDAFLDQPIAGCV